MVYIMQYADVARNFNLYAVFCGFKIDLFLKSVDYIKLIMESISIVSLGPLKYLKPFIFQQL